MWYGWQTLIADGSSVAAVMLGGALSANRVDSGAGLVALGVASYALASPIVHWSHGRVGTGFLSLGVRTVTPLLGLMLVLRGFDEDRYSGGSPMIVAGLALAILSVPGSITLDAAVLAYEKKRGSSSSLIPLVQPRSGGATLGLGGSF